MGWYGREMDREPSMEEIERIVEPGLQSSAWRVIERSEWRPSKWYGSGQVRFYLIEYLPEVRPEQEARRGIVLTTVSYQDGEFMWRLNDETEEPIEYDCPVELIHAANQYPAISDSAARWRSDVLEYQEHGESGTKP